VAVAGSACLSPHDPAVVALGPGEPRVPGSSRYRRPFEYRDGAGPMATHQVPKAQKGKRFKFGVIVRVSKHGEIETKSREKKRKKNQQKKKGKEKVGRTRKQAIAIGVCCARPVASKYESKEEKIGGKF